MTIYIGVSSCLLGQEVRYDGGHKRSGFVATHLEKFVKFKPICPEMGIGMPTPRPPIRLVEDGQQTRLMDAKTQTEDHTDAMTHFYQQKRSQFADLDGFILTAKSPSCGVHRIKVHGADGNLSHRKGRGLFAQQLIEDYPILPVEEDGRLNDSDLRESFITRVYCHADWRDTMMDSNKPGDLVKFHSRYKFLVMGYSNPAYQQLGGVVAKAGQGDFQTTKNTYISLLMQTLSKPTNRKKQTNALMHLQGFFKKQLSSAEKKELSELIHGYRQGFVPIHSPITLLNHYLMRYPNEYLANQKILNPYPVELGLRG